MRSHSAPTIGAFVAIGVVASASASRAQVIPATATLTGTVRENAGTSVPGVRITAKVSGITTLTDSLGKFILRGLPDGTLAFTVRRIGFEPAEFSASLGPGMTLNLDVTLAQAAVQLAGMETNAETRLRRGLETFYRHKSSSAGGHFIVRADIEARHPDYLSDMMRSIPGVQLLRTGNGRYIVRMARSSATGGRDCPVEYWVDGIHVQAYNIDDMPVSDVEALEVYAGGANLPPEYNIKWGTPGCGTIVIWTRIPGT